ncbi:hypothetical protein [Ruegeria sp. HKCCA0235A]|uniref:hypothetical protein n=1 Tax=Ruegeria sp. HKCCA0235A TaxID=2682998 RepID=UPI001489F862|nr:hypothetical protein [Ruegeria sp. HKCCA0235A]
MDDFYAARTKIIPPLPWSTFSPPFSPNAEDIIAGVTSISQKELEAGAKRNTEIIARVLEPYSSAIESCDLTVDQYADFIQRSSTAAKYSAKNKKHLIELLSALRMSALKVTSSV